MELPRCEPDPGCPKCEGTGTYEWSESRAYGYDVCPCTIPEKWPELCERLTRELAEARGERDKYREALEKIADKAKWVPDSRYEGAQHGDDHSIGYMDAASDAEAMADRALTGEEGE